MGQANTASRRINAAEGVAGQALLSGGPGAVETWGAPAPAIHGAAKHTDVTRELFLPANEAHVDTGTPNKRGSYGVVDGGANVNEPLLYWSIKVPDDFVSFGSVKAVWTVNAGVSNMYWRITAYYAAESEDLTTHSDSPALGVTANAGGYDFNVQEPANPLTLANLAIGDILGLFFYREGANALDTLNQTCQLYGLIFTYVANQ